jgi:HEAT repeat protein
MARNRTPIDIYDEAPKRPKLALQEKLDFLAGLYEHPDSAAFEGSLLLLLELGEDRSPKVRTQVAKTLTRYQNAYALNILMPLADDGNPDVRLAAVGALSLFARNDVYEKLMGIARDDPSHVIRATALRGLYTTVKRLDRTALRTFIQKQVAAERQLPNKIACYEVLCLLGDARALDSLFQVFLSTRNSQNRVGVLQSLSIVLDEQNLERITGFVEDMQGRKNSASVMAALAELQDQCNAFWAYLAQKQQ